jgi:uracil-DNA glycosylase
VTREERLEAISDAIRDHLPCGFEPCESCSSFVPGEGNAEARIVLVGEAPGANEDRLGRPFVGAAGKFLDTLLAEAGLAREEVFITNVLKSRPPGNRDPRADEIAHSWPWLEAQLAVIEPELVVPLGRHALARFDPGAKIADVHGRPHRAGGRDLFPLYHPAAALHGGKLRGALLDDARALGQWLNR